MGDALLALIEARPASTTMVLLQGHWRMRASGAEVKALAANVFTFETGRIRSYTVLNNTAAFAQALG